MPRDKSYKQRRKQTIQFLTQDETRRLFKAIKKLRDDGYAVWEEEDYCTPPLAQERAAVLDGFFDGPRGDGCGEGRGMG